MGGERCEKGNVLQVFREVALGIRGNKGKKAASLQRAETLWTIESVGDGKKV